MQPDAQLTCFNRVYNKRDIPFAAAENMTDQHRQLYHARVDKYVRKHGPRYIHIRVSTSLVRQSEFQSRFLDVNDALQRLKLRCPDSKIVELHNMVLDLSGNGHDMCHQLQDITRHTGPSYHELRFVLRADIFNVRCHLGHSDASGLAHKVVVRDFELICEALGVRSPAGKEYFRGQIAQLASGKVVSATCCTCRQVLEVQITMSDVEEAHKSGKDRLCNKCGRHNLCIACLPRLM